MHRQHCISPTGRTRTLALLGFASWMAMPGAAGIGPHSVRVPSQARTGLSLEDRVAVQRTIEDVYWRHRIWPKQNPQPKPALDAVMPDAVLRAKVEDYLRQSQALEVYWQRPMTGDQLQAEMERMARHTKQPDLLKELWAALGNDPYVIAECLARLALSNRLIRNWYAYDERYHGELKRRAEAELQAYGTVSQMRGLSGEYREMEWTNGARQPKSDQRAPAMLNAEQWAERVRELAQLFGRATDVGATMAAEPVEVGAEIDRLPMGELSDLQEDDDRFYVVAVLEKGDERVTVSMVQWRKEPFDAWWGRVREQMPEQVAAPAYAYRLVPIASGSGSCADDTWKPTSTTDVPRFGKAVWTGAEMIVWGGGAGARYDPATDTWTLTTTTDAPSARSGYTAVWSGTEMIVWGGGGAGTYFNTGGRYDPATDTWAATSLSGAPSARFDHTAVWTGAELIVWGGQGDGFIYLTTGGRYDPATDTWTPTATGNAPSPRRWHTAVWTGGEMIVWGGASTSTGGRYDPTTDTWTPTTTTDAPSTRSLHTAVWTGREMIVWGGERGPLQERYNTGGRYDPETDTWRATPTTSAPSGRIGHTAIWTGRELIIWAGIHTVRSLNTGGRYDLATDTWTAISTTNAPRARSFHYTVWTGRELIVWGGYDFYFGSGLVLLNTGGRYDPASDTWTPTSTTGGPSALSDHTAVWTGTEMIVWGGDDVVGWLDTGGRYDPATDTWTPTTTTDAPSARSGHTAVWTGREMIVWGRRFGAATITGGRYDPATDTWTPTSTTDAPSARSFHTAVWTGTQMIVWGGGAVTGGRYDPATDTWTPTSTTDAPSVRRSHTAVWTGTEMIVWGGVAGGPSLNTGGRYDPATDTWTPTSTTDAPSARSDHTAVWTGGEMIVWGAAALNTGGRYDPASDSWTPTSTTDAPSARSGHTAVWTDREMIVWGGSRLNTGGRYDPATDSWTPTSTSDAPSARSGHTAVWTGGEMIVWGGRNPPPGRSFVDTGGRYCASAKRVLSPE